MQLYDHQRLFLQQNINKTALIWGCGTGKTITAILWAKKHEALGTVIVCPKALKTNWANNIDQLHLQNVIVLSKEEFKKTPPLNYRQIIVDEVHNGFLTPMFKSQMSKALRAFCKGADRVLLLTATPYTSSPWNIYNMSVYMGLSWNWKKFEQTFFYKIRMGRRFIPQVKRGSEELIGRLIKKYCSVVDIKECIDVPPQVHTEPELFSLTKEQMTAIANNYDPLPIVRYTKQHEIEQGILLPDEFSKLQTFKADKNERILDLVKENKKIAIVCRYNAQIDSLQALLREYDPLIIRGNVKDRHAVCEEAERREKCVILLQSDCAEGYQLPSFGLCVFASQSYSYVKHEQICGRFLRIDKPSKTTFIYLLTTGDSIDKAVYNSVIRKKIFNLEVYAKERAEVQHNIQSLA